MLKQEISKQYHDAIMMRLEGLIRRAEDDLKNTPDFVIQSMRTRDRKEMAFTRWDDKNS